MVIDNQLFGILVFYTAINLIAFFFMLADKMKATKPGVERISEVMLFFLATALGGLGVYLGMFIFRHKIRKWYFVLGIPLLIMQNIALLYLFYLFLRGEFLF